jgi:hypothetical protein
MLGRTQKDCAKPTGVYTYVDVFRGGDCVNHRILHPARSWRVAGEEGR